MSLTAAHRRSWVSPSSWTTGDRCTCTHAWSTKSSWRLLGAPHAAEKARRKTCHALPHKHNLRLPYVDLRTTCCMPSPGPLRVLQHGPFEPELALLSVLRGSLRSRVIVSVDETVQSTPTLTYR
eukprot:7179106-Prymnesium_polylepis.1